MKFMNKYLLTIAIIIILFTGLNGLIAFSLLLIFSDFNYGRDSSQKHGLSSGQSRLGGLAIFISIAIGSCSHFILRDDLNISQFLLEFDSIIYFSLLIGLIGLAEDINQNLSSTRRLLYMLILVCISLSLRPELIPIDLEVFSFFGTNSLFLPMFVFSVIMVSGFINAGNIADGANGLLASIFFSFFVIAYTIDSSIFNFSVVISLLAFIIFNVFTGRIFLGDFGSYSLSSLVAFKSLEFYSNNDISVFFLSAILIYPCFEIMRSLIIRAIKSRSIMAPDNNHLHNYLNKFVLDFGFTSHTSNSITGLGIGVSTSILPIILYCSK